MQLDGRCDENVNPHKVYGLAKAAAAGLQPADFRRGACPSLQRAFGCNVLCLPFNLLRQRRAETTKQMYDSSPSSYMNARYQETAIRHTISGDGSSENETHTAA